MQEYTQEYTQTTISRVLGTSRTQEDTHEKQEKAQTCRGKGAGAQKKQ
jgi:hypothetical protein